MSILFVDTKEVEAILDFLIEKRLMFSCISYNDGQTAIDICTTSEALLSEIIDKFASKESK